MSLPPRVTTPLGVREIAGWRLKLYGIAVRDPVPRASLVTAALDRATEVLPETAPGFGFVIAHDARPGCFVLVACVWELAVLAHEAAAWARHTDDPAAYLTDVFSSR